MKFITNEYLNEMFPLASCPSGSMDNDPSAAWYIQELSTRLLAALHIGDKETMKQLQARIEIHHACRAYAGKI